MTETIRRLTKLLLVAFALALTGRAAAAEIVVWHAYRGEEKVALEKVAAAYNAKTPASKVTLLAVPFDAFADKITAAVPRGKGPDVFIAAHNNLGGWVEAGNTIEPLDFFLDDATKKRFIPSTMEAMTYRGSVYGLPLNYKAITLIYNKKLVQAPPRNSTELVEMAKKLTDKNAGRFGLAYWYSNFYYHAALMNAFGGRVFDAGTKPVLDNAENVKSFQQLMTWVKKDQILPAEPSTALVTALFNQGKAAMVFNGPWFLGEIAPGVEYGVAKLPTLVEAGGAPMRPWITVEGVSVAAPSKSKEAAYDFVRYLTDVDASKVMALEGRQCPANVNAQKDPAVAKDPILAGFRDQVEVAIPMPNVPEMAMVWSPATTAMSTILRGTDPKVALQTAQKQVEKDVANLRKK
jgi:arabinogalactan oligomer/maltooligosaccharide transport system substrate-binding protein